MGTGTDSYCEQDVDSAAVDVQFGAAVSSQDVTSSSSPGLSSSTEAVIHAIQLDSFADRSAYTTVGALHAPSECEQGAGTAPDNLLVTPGTHRAARGAPGTAWRVSSDAQKAAVPAPDVDDVVRYFASFGKQVVIMDDEEESDDGDSDYGFDDEGPTTTEDSGIFLAPDPLVQINVKGLLENTLVLDVAHATRVLEVKQMICDKAGIDPDDQYLTFAGRRLKSGHTLWHYQVHRDSTIWLSLRLGGSAPKPKANVIKGNLKPKGGDMSEVDKRLTTAEKIKVLKDRTTRAIKREGDDGEKLPAAEQTLLGVAKTLNSASANWLSEQIGTMLEPALTELKADMEANTGRGKKAVEWICNEDTVARFVPVVKAKLAEQAAITQGLDAVMTAWKLRVSSSCMADDGSIQLDDVRRQITSRLDQLKGAGAKPTMSAARVTEIRTMLKMVGVLPTEQMNLMSQKLNITKEEMEYVKGLDDDMEL